MENKNINIMPHNSLEGPKPEIAFNLHDGSEEQVTIIIVHKDRPEYLNILLQSIAVTSFNNNYEIIVVDNGSGTEGQHFLDDIQDQVKVVRNKENLYWSAAANKGAQLADRNSKYLIFLHCDVVILNPAWMDLLINVSEAQQSGMVGVELQSYFMQGQKVDFVQEWCLLVTRDCWKDAGPFHEDLKQIGSSFILTMKAQKKGYKPQVMKNPICHHYRIFSLNINEYEQLQEATQTAIPKIIAALQAETV